MEDPKEYYKSNINNINKNLKELERTISAFAVGRLLIVVVAIATMYYLYKADKFIYLCASFMVVLITFIVTAIFHNNKINEKEQYLLKLEYNEKGLKRINGEWKEFEDKGEEFLNSSHNFSSDLDIFGNNSLFQWINTTKSPLGRKKLAKVLALKSLPDKQIIKGRQEAIKELSEKRGFCEKIYISFNKGKKDKHSVDKFLQLMEKDEKVSFTVRYIQYLFITITLLFLYLTVAGRIPVNYLILDLFINYLVVKLLTKNLSDSINIILENKKAINQYEKTLRILSSEEFTSKNLVNLKEKLINSRENCMVEINKLKNIVNWIGDSNANAYYLLLNVFMLSDIFVLYNLEKWRRKNGFKIRLWIETIAEFEALISISNIAFDNPKWSYPKFTEERKIECKGIAHPLLGEKAESNDFALHDGKKAALITGSNMSGKSTFLRTIGFNMVLGYIGSPVRAESLNSGIFNIYTCMRTQDNLEESISSFYAEILRIKLVIEAARSGEKVFFLLDEIFKGTNSKDRHDGAKILIEQLVKSGGIGLVSTHDFELCDLENIHNWLVNFNFQEYYVDDKIKFDYKLRDGRSKTQNAKYLMKLAGIEIVEN